MATKRALARRLSAVAGFDRPRVALEQYVTPAELAAHLVHFADITGDVAGRTIVDLGTGTGMLALGAALRAPREVIGIDRDRRALAVATENRERVAPPTPVSWIRGDVPVHPFCFDSERRGETTVVMNPPFGAQAGNRHADRAFLETAGTIAGVSYSIHNRGSHEFVESFAADAGGTVTHAFRSEFKIDRQFTFHEKDRDRIEVEVFRIVWNRG